MFKKKCDQEKKSKKEGMYSKGVFTRVCKFHKRYFLVESLFAQTFAIVKQYVRRDVSGIEQLPLLNTPHNFQSSIYTLSKKPLDSKEIVDSISHSGSSGKDVPISLLTLMHTLV